jgi:hypothetical protein
MFKFLKPKKDPKEIRLINGRIVILIRRRVHG